MGASQLRNVEESANQEHSENANSVGSSRDDFFTRLLARGVDYTEIQQIVRRSVPQATLFLQREFGKRSIGQVLDQLDRWHEFLDKDFLLSPEEKQALEKTLGAKELIACNALLEDLFSQRDQWSFQATIVPSGEDESGRPLYIHPGVRLAARNRDTGQTLELDLRGEKLCDPARWARTLRMAFETLRSQGVTIQPGRSDRLISAHGPQGWPVFTQRVIPQLYEYLTPFFPSRAHYSEGTDSGVTGEPRRNALYSKELLETILEILRHEHKNVFCSATLADIRAVIQRHVERKAADEY